MASQQRGITDWEYRFFSDQLQLYSLFFVFWDLFYCFGYVGLLEERIERWGNHGEALKGPPWFMHHSRWPFMQLEEIIHPSLKWVGQPSITVSLGKTENNWEQPYICHNTHRIIVMIKWEEKVKLLAEFQAHNMRSQNFASISFPAWGPESNWLKTKHVKYCSCILNSQCSFCV